MTGFVNVNGSIRGAQEATVSIFDHGFLFGEGIYEVVRTYQARLFVFDRHMRRLRKSAELIVLSIPLTDEEFRARIHETMGAVKAAAPKTDEFYVRIIVTRGVGELSYDPRLCPAPSIVIIVKAFIAQPPEVYERGVGVILASVIRNHPGSINPLIKSNNLLNNALAVQEAYRRGAYEAVMRNHRGELSECAQANLFVVKNGTIFTPPLDSGILAGITRELVFEIGPIIGTCVREQVLHDSELFAADEAFLTSTTRNLVPIVRVDDRAIGTAHPGAITRNLLLAYHHHAQELAKE